MGYLRDAVTPATEIPRLQPVIEHITCPLSYTVDNLESFILPDNIGAEEANRRIGVSRIKNKKIVVGAAGDLVLTPLEEAALRWELAALCAEDSGGKQWRAVLPLGPAKSPAVGQVIFGYDGQLNATALLVGRGLPLGGPGEDLTDDVARGRLASYGLGEIRGTWKTGDLPKVVRALTLLSGDEFAALAGVALERIEQLPSSEENAHTQAKFSYDSGPAVGAMGTIYVADRAFEEDTQGFYAGSDGLPARPPSFQVILHEAGHAIESWLRRSRARANAEFALASTGNVQKYALSEPIPQDDVTRALQLGFKNVNTEQSMHDAAVEAYNAISGKKAEADQLISTCEAKGGVMSTLAEQLRKFKAGQGAKSAEAQIQLIESEQERVEEAYRFIASKLIPVLNSLQPEKLTPGNFDTLRNAVQGLDHEPWLSFYQQVMRWCDVQQRAAVWRQDNKKSAGRRTAFAAYVSLNSISADLTGYSARKWPQFPHEYYCEAFSIWRIDPLALGQHSPELRGYFEKNLHLGE